jgi:hypothetical protein
MRTNGESNGTVTWRDHVVPENALRINLARRIIVAVFVPLGLVAILWCFFNPYGVCYFPMVTLPWAFALLALFWFQWFWWGPPPEPLADVETDEDASPLPDDPAVTWMNDPEASLPEPEPADPQATGLADSGADARA